MAERTPVPRADLHNLRTLAIGLTLSDRVEAANLVYGAIAEIETYRSLYDRQQEAVKRGRRAFARADEREVARKRKQS